MIDAIIKKVKGLKGKFFIDKKFRCPRIWSNNELRKIAVFLDGDVINVSGWKDLDKEGGSYEAFFSNLNSYTVSNYKGDSGFQGNIDNEIYVDLEQDLDEKYLSKFDVVFNHTTLEHVFDINKGFKNLCLLSKDILIIVVPFLQELHFGSAYKDYWRFTPYAIKKLFENNNFELIYINSNNKKNESTYIFAVGSKNHSKWKGKIDYINKDLFSNLGEKIIS